MRNILWNGANDVACEGTVKMIRAALPVIRLNINGLSCNVYGPIHIIPGID